MRCIKVAAAAGSSKMQVTRIKTRGCVVGAAVEAFHVCPSLDILIPALREGGVEGLEERISLMPGARRACSHSHHGPAQPITLVCSDYSIASRCMWGGSSL